MNPEEEFQRYASLIEYYKNQLATLENQFSYLQATIMDYSQAKITLEKIKETKKDTEILIPIGGGTFAFAKAKDTSKILTDIGSGIVVEKNPEEAIEVIEKRIDVLQKNQDSLTTMSQQIHQQIDEISMKAQQILASANQG